jgi:hypothetical protein
MEDEMTPDEYTRDKMQQLAREIDDQLPAGWGFILLCFPFDAQEGRTNYIANASREDAKILMKEFIDGTCKGWGKHV